MQAQHKKYFEAKRFLKDKGIASEYSFLQDCELFTKILLRSQQKTWWQGVFQWWLFTHLNPSWNSGHCSRWCTDMLVEGVGDQDQPTKRSWRPSDAHVPWMVIETYFFCAASTYWKCTFATVSISSSQLPAYTLKFWNVRKGFLFIKNKLFD